MNKPNIDPNIFKGIGDELKKVTWPSKQEALNLTAVVVIISFLIGIYVGGLDSLFAQILKLFINLKS
jgi:preprotein translocase subunit SecE